MADPTSPSGQYGELREQHRLEASCGAIRRAWELVEAALEAKDREIEELKSGAFLDKAGLAHDLAIEAAQMSEQREAEARRLLSGLLKALDDFFLDEITFRNTSEHLALGLYEARVAGQNFLESKP